MKIYICEHCKFMFKSDDEITQCPDCGKFKVRVANQSETEEFEKRKEDDDVWS